MSPSAPTGAGPPLVVGARLTEPSDGDDDYCDDAAVAPAGGCRGGWCRSRSSDGDAMAHAPARTTTPTTQKSQRLATLQDLYMRAQTQYYQENMYQLKDFVKTHACVCSEYYSVHVCAGACM